MKFDELSREQKVEVKQRLLCERLGRDEHRSPSWDELADADSTISDEECGRAFAGTDFVPEDFTPERDDTGLARARGLLTGLAKWIEDSISDADYAADKDRYLPINHDETCGIDWARGKILAHIRELAP